MSNSESWILWNTSRPLTGCNERAASGGPAASNVKDVAAIIHTCDWLLQEHYSKSWKCGCAFGAILLKRQKSLWFSAWMWEINQAFWLLCHQQVQQSDSMKTELKSQLPGSIGSHLRRAARYDKECTKRLICKLSVIFKIFEFSKGLSTTAVASGRLIWSGGTLMPLSTHYWCTDHLHWPMQTGRPAVWLTHRSAGSTSARLSDWTGSLPCCQTDGRSAVCLRYRF